MSRSRVVYTPFPPPKDVEGIGPYLETELQQIASIIGELSERGFELNNNEPERPREGQVEYADGTNWNPGSGKGLYQYRSGVWVLLG